jgi:hypothetical protein
MALPPLIILVVWFLEQRWQSLTETMRAMRRGIRPVVFMLYLNVAILLMCAAYSVMSEKRYYHSLAGWWWYQRHKEALTALYMGPQWVAEAEWVPLRAERGGGIRVPRFQAEEVDGVSRFLLESTAPGEALFTFPEHGIFHFLADRPSPSRFAIAGFAWTTPAWRHELLSALRTMPPRVVVKGTRLSNLARAINRTEELLPEVEVFLRDHYRILQRFPTIEILERQR